MDLPSLFTEQMEKRNDRIAAKVNLFFMRHRSIPIGQYSLIKVLNNGVDLNWQKLSMHHCEIYESTISDLLFGIKNAQTL